MSREFGDRCGGFFHQKIESCASDCDNASRDHLTKLWGKFLRAFEPVAYAIATSEACDSGPDYPIFQTIKSWSEMKSAIDDIEKYIEPYKRVAEEAVRSSVEK